MAERRMFAKSIVSSDAFLDMPFSAQSLYFHLGMEADDDGFIAAPKRVTRAIGAKEDDLNLLFAKRFVLPFESGVAVVKHWRINNYIQKDRRKPTNYIEELSQLSCKDNGAYTLKQNAALTCGNVEQLQAIYELDTECIQDVSNLSTQDSIGKDSIGKDSSDKKPVRHKYGQYSNVLLTDSDLSKLKAEFPSDWEQRVERLSEYMASTGKHYKNHLATMRSWARKEGVAPSGKYSKYAK